MQKIAPSSMIPLSMSPISQHQVLFERLLGTQNPHQVMSPASVGHSGVECPDAGQHAHIANHPKHIDFCLNKVGSGLEPSILLYEWVWILGGVYIVFILCVYYDISTSYWVFTQNCSGFH